MLLPLAELVQQPGLISPRFNIVFPDWCGIQPILPEHQLISEKEENKLSKERKHFRMYSKGCNPAEIRGMDLSISSLRSRDC